ncbi:MAG: glycosyltransferase family 2 protein [Chloroflexota bacterium]
MTEVSPPLTISVIVPVHNGGENFRQCLIALQQALSPIDTIIVVADGVTDDSIKITDDLEIQVLRTPVRAGPAQARNQGARSSQGDILFFVDADVLVYPHTIDLVRSVFTQHPNLAAIFGSYDNAPYETNFLSQYKNLLHHKIHLTSNEDASTFWSGCGAIRREVFFNLDGYDENFDLPAIEDIELGYRLKKGGYKIRLEKILQVKHLKYWDARTLLKTDFFQRALPWTQLILRERLFINDLNLRISSRVSVILTYVLFCALLTTPWQPSSLFLAGFCATLLLVINRSLYRFFMEKRGLWFTLRVIPWHWFYYFYSGLAFILGTLRYFWGQVQRSFGKRALKSESSSKTVPQQNPE